MYLGHGIVGGKLLDSHTHGRTAAEMAIRIIEGENPADIPVVLKSTNPYMFDYEQLRRWGIGTSGLPDDSIVLNEPFSIYEEYKAVIWGVLGLIVFLTATIVILVANTTRRKFAEAELSRSEAKFRGLIESSADWIWEVTREGIYTYASPQVEDILGYKPQEIVGRTPFDLMPPDEAATIEEIFRSLAEKGEPVVALENVNLHKDGRRVVLETSGVPVLDNDGAVIGYRGVDRDITYRKRAEEELLKEKAFSDAAIASLPGMFYVFDHNGKFLRWNRNLESISGYSPDELVEMRAEEFYHPSQRPLIIEKIKEVLARGWGTAEADFLSKDGSTTAFSLTGARFELEGKPCLVGVGLDVSERKRAEEALRESERTLREAQEMAHLGHWSWDVNTGEVQWSEEIYRIFGLNPEEFTPRIDSIMELSPWPEDNQRDKELFQRAIDNCEPGSYEQRFLRPDGSTGHYFSTFQGVYDDDGGLIAMRGTAQDITDRKRAEKEREDLIAKLEAQNAELERFTYTVSHDLKSPLITIKGYVGLLEQSVADGNMDDMQGDLARIAIAADKMGQLLADLLELSRIGRLTNPPEKVPLKELTEEVVELVGGQLGQRGVNVDVAPNLPVLFGDRTRLLEIVQNLIDNAVKYMGDQPRPSVKIGSRRDGDETVCYARDNGIGIDPRYHEKVFGLFDQLDQKVEGSGIGLSLVKRIVEVHGGRVWVESEGLGRGSTFCFTIAENRTADA